MNNNKITKKEKDEFERLLIEGLCICNHPRKEHNKFINGLFIGCMHKDCNCKSFTPKEFIK
jgi:hypothetical protein